MSREAPGGARVGPNAITQLGAALATLQGVGSAATVFHAAGLAEYLAEPPKTMVPQDWVARLHATLFEAMAQATARAVALEAGRRTADYLLTWRIPYPAQRLLIVLPTGLSARLLLGAIGRNAWTFAGSGGFAATSGRTSVVTIADNPIAVPGCPWHCGVLERLFGRLVTPRAHVVATGCCARGDPACQFEIRLDRGRNL